ncbi:MAG: SAM-dependent methyltransferase [Sporichthyaceae bacterium]
MATDMGWDVASGPGLTALGLAAARTVESSMLDGLIDDPLAVLFAAAATSPVAFPTAWPADGSTVSDRDALFLHGSRYIGVRSRFYDDFLLDAADAGLRQVVLLGAGLDTRAFRLPWPYGTRIFEVDRDRVLEFKNRVLADAEVVPACSRTTVATDLREDWLAGLRAAGFDEQQPTVWVAEGLLAYLAPAAQEALVRRVHQASALGSALAADRLLPLDKDGELALRRLADRSGMALDAILQTGGDYSPPQWLGGRGWTVAEDSTDAVAHRYGRDLADPFDPGSAPAVPPWLATAFVRARLNAPTPA